MSLEPTSVPVVQWHRVVGLGGAQTIAWASSTYLPALLALPIGAALDFSPTLLFAAFSLALGVMALLGPVVGRHIDRVGGRGVLCLSSCVLALGLALLGLAQGPMAVFIAWVLIGAGMALGLYDAAFAALVHEHGLEARLPITGITLLGGFASTIGWPLTAWLIAHWDWRMACFFWAGANLLIALPLYLRCVPPSRKATLPNVDATGQKVREETDAPATGWRERRFWLLALFGAATAFVTSAMAAHLPGILVATGLSAAAAIAASSLVGPAQVAARLAEFLAARKSRTDPLTTARVATSLHPLGVGVLFMASTWPAGAFLFAVCHGAGNGMITIAKGTLPLYLFGARGYGLLQGRLAVAQRTMQAAAPFAMALLIESGGAPLALSVSAGVSALALFALFALRCPD